MINTLKGAGQFFSITPVRQHSIAPSYSNPFRHSDDSSLICRPSSYKPTECINFPPQVKLEID